MMMPDPRPRSEPYPGTLRDIARRWEDEWSPLRHRLREMTAKSGRCA